MYVCIYTSTCLFPGDIWPESKAGFDRSQFEVVWGNIQWGEEVRLGLPMTHTLSLPHLPRMHMAGDGWHFGIGWGGGRRREKEGGKGESDATNYGLQNDIEKTWYI